MLDGLLSARRKPSMIEVNQTVAARYLASIQFQSVAFFNML